MILNFIKDKIDIDQEVQEEDLEVVTEDIIDDVDLILTKTDIEEIQDVIIVREVIQGVIVVGEVNQEEKVITTEVNIEKLIVDPKVNNQENIIVKERTKEEVIIGLKVNLHVIVVTEKNQDIEVIKVILKEEQENKIQIIAVNLNKVKNNLQNRTKNQNKIQKI